MLKYVQIDLWHRYATDFFEYVDSQTLFAPLVAKHVLSQFDMETLLLQTLTESVKLRFLFIKLHRLGKKALKFLWIVWNRL